MNCLYRVLTISILLLVTQSAYVLAASVYQKHGNIFYKDQLHITQVTTSNRDREPVLNSKGDWIYFVRSFEGKWKNEKYYPPKGKKIVPGLLKEELWRIKINGHESRMLYRNENEDAAQADVDYSVASISNIQFSPDGDKIYFETPDWVTSAGLHVMNSDGAKERRLGVGNDTKVVLSARTFDDREKSYRGYLVTNQHKYFFYGGSYDWYYLFTPDLKEVAPLGDDPKYFTEMGEIHYTDGSEKKFKK